jgi:O-antigen/teichoic acid export membrane protein
MFSFLNTFLHRTFLKNVGQVAAGTLVAQIGMVFAAPLLTAVFPPEAFGAFAVVVAVSSIIVTFSSLRLDVLIPFARTQADVAAFIQVVVLGPFVIAVLVATMLFFLPSSVVFWLGLDGQVFDTSFLVLFAAIGISCMAAMRGLAVRQGKFSMIGSAQVVRVLFLIAGSYCIGIYGWTDFGFGLIVGQVLGDLVFGLIVWFSLSPNFKNRLLTLRPTLILQSIRAEASAVKTLSATQAMAILYERSPPLIIFTAFGPVEAGFYALAVRISQAPLTLVSSAFDDVFRQRAAKLWSQGLRFTKMMRNGLIFTLITSILPIGLAITLTPILMEPVFGHVWAEASDTLVVMLIVAFFAFNSKSFDKVPIMLKAYRFIMAWHLTRFLLELVLGLMAIGGLLDYHEWLVLVAVGRSALYAIKLIAGFVLARSVPLTTIKVGT